MCLFLNYIWYLSTHAIAALQVCQKQSSIILLRNIGYTQADNSDNIKDNSNYENKGKPLILLFTSDIFEAYTKKGEPALSSFDHQEVWDSSSLISSPCFSFLSNPFSWFIRESDNLFQIWSQKRNLVNRVGEINPSNSLKRRNFNNTLVWKEKLAPTKRI